MLVIVHELIGYCGNHFPLIVYLFCFLELNLPYLKDSLNFLGKCFFHHFFVCIYVETIIVKTNYLKLLNILWDLIIFIYVINPFDSHDTTHSHTISTEL